MRIECVDWTGGQIGNNDSADDVLNVDLTKIHYLSGPFEIEGAEPGDVLLVEIMDVQPFEDQPWGFSGVVCDPIMMVHLQRLTVCLVRKGQRWRFPG